MTETFRISESFVEEHNTSRRAELEADYAALGERLARRGVDVDELTRHAAELAIAVPSWGVGTGGTRFARFPGPGEPRDVWEKIDDCATLHELIRITPRVSLHIPWDEPQDTATLRTHAAERGMGFDAMNSNTFQDQPGQALSYRYGSLTHTDPAVRRQAVEHNLRCLEIGRDLGSQALTVWIGDGANLPGQQDFRAALERYMESLREIYAALPPDWRLYIEYKPYEPAFYSTVIDDWGTAYWCVRELGSQARVLVDLGHHLPNTNVEMVVARLIQFEKLGGFHFNDSKYGDDDLDSGSIQPFQLFLVFKELVDRQLEAPDFAPAYMLDQSHNITDPLESLLVSAVEVQRACVRAHLVDRQALAAHQRDNDAVLARRVLGEAFDTDVSPVLAMARLRAGGAIDPLLALRDSGYRQAKAAERPAAAAATGGGIV